jgi:hypothetical protein
MQKFEPVAAPDAEGYLVSFREGFIVPSILSARAGEHGVRHVGET